jgi:Amt family ammonium transporter
MVMTGLLAHTSVNSANTTGNGLFYGETLLFFTHMKALVIVFGFTFVGSLLVLWVTDMISPLHATKEERQKQEPVYAEDNEKLLATVNSK